jgi:hydroxyacylglutathione hydrolase
MKSPSVKEASMMVKLEIYSPRLAEICFIEGIGLSSNVYTLGTEEVTVVDTGSGDEINRLAPKLRTLDLDPKKVKQVVLTHTHPDHTGGVEELAAVSSPMVLVHEDEAVDVEAFGLRVSKLQDGDSISAGGRKLEVIHTPGHTPGAVCLYDRKDRILFSGDTVFPEGGFGRTDLPGGDSRRLVESLERLAELEVDFILPGHMEPVRHEAKTHLTASYENAKSWL